MYKKLLIVLLFLVSLSACKTDDSTVKAEPDADRYSQYLSDTNPIIKMNFSNDTSLTMQLFYNQAPNTVLNFLSLIQEGVYNNTDINKISKDILFQAGDNLETDFGIYGEFMNNGFTNSVPFYKGIIGMVRDNATYSANSRFFVCLNDYNSFDGYFSGFGGIISGFDTLNELNNIETDDQNNPINEITITSIDILDMGGLNPSEVKRLDLSFQSPNTYLNDNNPQVELKVKGFADPIIIELFPDVAPETVANFLQLVDQQFYDGFIFHRVIKDFMIQTGDPTGTGTGGSDTTVYGEFKDNGYNNNLSHVEGVVSMARSNYYNGATSQFFIMDSNDENLNGSYAAFGYVISGLEVVHSIGNAQTNTDDKPLTDITIESIRRIQ